MKLIKKIHKQAGSTNSRILIILLGLSLLGVGAFAGVRQQQNNEGKQANTQPVISAAPEKPYSASAMAPTT